MEQARDYKQLNRDFLGLYGRDSFSSQPLPGLYSRDALASGQQAAVVTDGLRRHGWDARCQFRHAAMALALLAGLGGKGTELFECEPYDAGELSRFAADGGVVIAAAGPESETVLKELGIEPLIPLGAVSEPDEHGNASYTGRLSEHVVDYMYAHYARLSACSLRVGWLGVYELDELVSLYTMGRVPVELARRYEAELEGADTCASFLENVLPEESLPAPSNAYQEEARAYARMVKRVGRIWLRTQQSAASRGDDARWLSFKLDRECKDGEKSPAEAARELADAFGIEARLAAVLDYGVPLADVTA